MYRIIISFLFICPYLTGTSQTCDTNSFASFAIKLTTDQFAKETSFTLKNLTKDSTVVTIAPGQLENNQVYQFDFCLAKSDCFEFIIRDIFGDGIKAPGNYQLNWEDQLVQEGGDFGSAQKTELNCGPGASCNTAKLISTGVFQSSYSHPWFAFTADSLGTYSISTCGINGCDTKLWIYDNCEELLLASDQAGAIYFDDNEGGCGQQAQITNALLEQDQSYYIRIGKSGQGCQDSINLEIKFNGPVYGCTQPSSCNYDPFATIDDGSCLTTDDPACPGGPDLSVSQLVLENSLQLDTIRNTDICMLEEGCLRGYGKRDIIRFSTLIANLGEQDYYLGKIADNQGQFNENNCHQHLHYENYAAYLLFDEFGRRLPVGFKNGFCITDLSCDPGIEKKYNCANMGLTAGCQDIYLSGLDCQWIDITDLPEGLYTLAIQINWNQSPDLLGRRETNYDNNWAQVCFELIRRNGQLAINKIDNCKTYADCTGTPYGQSSPDCNGICNGIAIRGDLDQNGLLDSADILTYSQSILQEDINAEPCYDLNADGKISVFDAALLNSCLRSGTVHVHGPSAFHNHCDFPNGIEKKQDTAFLFLDSIDYQNQYLELGLLSQKSEIGAFQLKFKGISIKEVLNLTTKEIVLNYDSQRATVLGGFPEDKPLAKTTDKIRLLGIYYESTNSDSVCLSQKMEIINSNTERISTLATKLCIASAEAVSTTNLNSSIQISVYPNPAKDYVLFRTEPKANELLHFSLTNISGQLIISGQYNGSQFQLDTSSLAKGVYFFQLERAGKRVSGKLLVN